DNQSMFYGDSLPALTATYTGFVKGDTPASLATPVVISTTATPTSSVGPYAITPSRASSSNYAIKFVPGTLTVNKASTRATLTSSANPSPFGQSVTFTVAFTPQFAGLPSGTVTISSDGSPQATI